MVNMISVFDRDKRNFWQQKAKDKREDSKSSLSRMLNLKIETLNETEERFLRSASSPVLY
jgi:hypothetical protein